MVKKQPITSVKGMYDILPEEQPYWDKIRQVVFEVAKFYGFGYLETPVLEEAILFDRTAGASSDVVTKQMYSFRTKGGDLVSLRPEGTAPVARAYIEHGWASLPQPVKVFYFEPMYRYESPQAGRYREHHQFGFEMFGLDDPLGDAQMVQISFAILRELGLKKLMCEVNTIGDKDCRDKYKQALKAYLRPHLRKLGTDDRRRYKANVLRVLDTKDEATREIIKNAPQIVDYVCDDCKDHFKKFLEFLDELEIPYMLNPYLVRGFDYYSRTVFEIKMEGAETLESTVTAGGRYDGLVQMVGGKATPAVGFGAGVERIILEMKKGGARVSRGLSHKIFLIQLGDLAKKKGLKLLETLRKEGISVGESLGKHSIRSQMKIADKLGAKLSLILGQKEALSDEIIVRDMRSGVQETIPLTRLVGEIKRRLATLK